jgi:hypothetical protein
MSLTNSSRNVGLKDFTTVANETFGLPRSLSRGRQALHHKPLEYHCGGAGTITEQRDVDALFPTVAGSHTQSVARRSLGIRRTID